MDNLKRFKLYKSGKKWCLAAITTVVSTASLVALNSTFATANDNPTTSVNTTQVKQTNSNGSQTTPANNNQQNTVKNGWQQATDKSWTYYNNGKTTSGKAYQELPTINGKGTSWYLTDNGKALSGVQEWAGSYWDFDKTNYMLSQKKDYFKSDWGDWYLKDSTGRIQSGVQEWAGSYWYFDPTTYLLSQKKDYIKSQWGEWYLVGNDGRIQSGVQEWAGSYWYFDPTYYTLSKKRDYVKSQWGDYYLVGNDGRIQSGLQEWAGSLWYFDPVTYLVTKNKDITVNGNKYHADKNGFVTKIEENGLNIPTGTKNTLYYNNGKVYFVKPDGNLAKNEEVQTPVGKLYFDKNGVVGYTGISAHHDAFLSSIVNGAVQGWVEHGVLPSLTLAQAIIESGWGQSTLSSRYHNLFGIKASHGWTGKVANMPTGEYFNGKYVMINDGFRAYDNNDQSVKDHALFLVQNSRYSNLLWDKNYTSVTRKIQQDGYATAPTYATTLQSTIRNYMLDDYDRIAFAIKK